MSQEAKAVASNFTKYFRAELANDSALLDQVQHVRYRVYCEEFHYEPLERCPQEKEQDDYDAQSTHCLITHLPSMSPAGCVRMVPTLEHDPDALLPFERYCQNSLNHTLIASLNLDRSTICEISRLAVDRNFRRRPGEQETRIGSTDPSSLSEVERRTFPFIAASAYLAATAMTFHTERTNVFAMMEPFLPRLLRRVGIDFTRVGSDVDYRGTRAAYFITSQSALDGMAPDLTALYKQLEKQLYG